MNEKQIAAKLNYLETRVQSLESSWRAEKFNAEQEITKRWRKKVHKGFLYRIAELWYVRKALAEDAGYLVLEV
jgi:hypothetical protein